MVERARRVTHLRTGVAGLVFVSIATAAAGQSRLGAAGELVSSSIRSRRTYPATTRMTFGHAPGEVRRRLGRANTVRQVAAASASRCCPRWSRCPTATPWRVPEHSSLPSALQAGDRFHRWRLRGDHSRAVGAGVLTPEQAAAIQAEAGGQFHDRLPWPPSAGTADPGSPLSCCSWRLASSARARRPGVVTRDRRRSTTRCRPTSSRGARRR